MCTAEPNRSTREGPKLSRRRRDSLGALSSLVSFDEPEDTKSEQETEFKSGKEGIRKTTKSTQADVSILARMMSAPYPPSTLVGGGVPSLRKTLSQDWLKSSFSPRPGKEPRRDMFLGSGCMRSQRPLNNILSLRSIPEENELDPEEGSELSDDHILPKTLSRPISSPETATGQSIGNGGEAKFCLRDSSSN